MAKRRAQKHMTAREMAVEVYAHRDDPGEWDDTPLQAEEIGEQRVVIVSFRIPIREFVAMQKAVKESGETVSQFIRVAIATRLRGGAVANAVNIAGGLHWGTMQATFLAPALSTGQAENPSQVGPDPERVPALRT